MQDSDDTTGGCEAKLTHSGGISFGDAAGQMQAEIHEIRSELRLAGAEQVPYDCSKNVKHSCDLEDGVE